MMEWIDRSVLEAVSWKLASELARRHPETTRLIRAHPGGGQSDCLWLLPIDDGTGDIRLNRNGTIQVLGRFDGLDARQWEPTEWETYLGADPRDFLHGLEVAAGLPIPKHVPSATPTTLVFRVLAAIASTAVKSVHPIEIQEGFIGSSGYNGGPNEALDTFAAIPRDLLRPRVADFFGEPGYRFWIVLRDQAPILAFEQSEGLAWTTHHDESFSVMEIFEQAHRSVLITALELLRHADQI
jgi:hypothetical protein